MTSKQQDSKSKTRVQVTIHPSLMLLKVVPTAHHKRIGQHTLLRIGKSSSIEENLHRSSDLGHCRYGFQAEPIPLEKKK